MCLVHVPSAFGFSTRYDLRPRYGFKPDAGCSETVSCAHVQCVVVVLFFLCSTPQEFWETEVTIWLTI